MGADLVHRIRPPDDAGRRDEHVIWLGPDRGSDTGDDLFGVSEAPGPVATFAFFEMTTYARSCPSETFQRLSTTLGPEKRLFVNTAAAAHGRSAAMTTKSSVSSLMPTFAT
jgi:hypothetical protein